MRLLQLSLYVLGAVASSASSDPTTTTQPPACTATSSTGSGAFFDLRPDAAVVPEKGKSSRYGVTKDYHAKGHDYGKNFTLNICGSVVEEVLDVVGVDEARWANVSAYYMEDGKVYSIGSESLDLRSRGRKVVLQYTGGSPCGQNSSSLRRREFGDPFNDGDSDLDKPDEKSDEKANKDNDASSAGNDLVRRKSTIISFHCDRDPGVTQAAISFVGTDPDECAYFFEARSIHACAHAEPHKPGSVGPGSVFGLILLIAIMVYFLGGVFYNRTVSHARGWRQLPNYSLWAGIWGFICDFFMIALSACARRLAPSRGGYSHLNSSPTRRSRDAEAENRLIDQLDEEWDD